MKRESITKADQLHIFNRDHWTCKYCGVPVFFGPTLKLLENHSPGHGYYHQHGKSGEMLRLFQMRLATVDHIVPVTRGGLNEIDNYVTACWECNLTLGDAEVEEKSPHNASNNDNIEVGWDGMASLYPKLTTKNDAWVKLIKDE